VLASVGDLRALLSANENAAATRIELSKHVKEIAIAPGDGGEIKCTGKWDLLGDGGNMDGAEGGNCSQLPKTLRPVIPFERIFKRAA
jgi:hypothetical protein